jgi:hypothetical protein
MIWMSVFAAVVAWDDGDDGVYCLYQSELWVAGISVESESGSGSGSGIDGEMVIPTNQSTNIKGLINILDKQVEGVEKSFHTHHARCDHDHRQVH